MLEDMLLLNFGNKRKSPRRRGPNIVVCKTWDEVRELYNGSSSPKNDTEC